MNFTDKVLGMTPQDVIAYFEQSSELRGVVGDLQKSFGESDPGPEPQQTAVDPQGPPRWGELSDGQKDKVNRYIDLLLAKQTTLPLVEKTGREVVQQRKIGSVSYQLEKVRCGKDNCKSCPHGPYWYAYYRKGKRTVSKYIGKEFKQLAA